MPADPYENNPLRTCLACGKEDRGPRDVVGLPDGGTANYHFDCHVLTHDCPVCRKVLEEIGTTHTNEGSKDKELLEKLLDALDPNTGPVPKIFTVPNARLYALGQDEENN